MRGFLQWLLKRGKPKTDLQLDFSWLLPPPTMVDPEAWDRYWRDRATHGLAGLADMWCSDGDLVDAMRANGLRTVLCLGNGISQEPRALAWAGFSVTALDLSPLATQMASQTVPPSEYLSQLIDERAPAPNGLLEYVVGDLRDASICPGPFDVVIDRKTLQLYPDEERPSVLRAVARRVASPGIFFSQCHDSGWHAQGEPMHATKGWFTTEGWQHWYGETPLTGRVAWLFTSTG